MSRSTVRERNDPGQYDDLAEAWWDPQGPLAMLHWIATARSELVPPATRADSVLIDLGCGGGLLAPHVLTKGHRHVGVDLTTTALSYASAHGVLAVRGDVASLPIANGSGDVVSAGEILEHVVDLRQVISEACRVLRPGGTLIIDTIAATWLARVLAITVAERIPGGAPPGIHDPALFVDRDLLIRECARHGVDLQLFGLRPTLFSLLCWRFGQRPAARMVRTWSTAVLFQAIGTKSG